MCHCIRELNKGLSELTKFNTSSGFYAAIMLNFNSGSVQFFKRSDNSILASSKDEGMQNHIFFYIPVRNSFAGLLNPDNASTF